MMEALTFHYQKSLLLEGLITRHLTAQAVEKDKSLFLKANLNLWLASYD